MEITSNLATEITPEFAAKLLEKRGVKRPLNIATVKRYQRALEGGRFMLGTDMVATDNNGNLLNGQHRCTACVNSGITFRAFFATGLDSAIYDILDSGKIRTGTDHMAGLNESNGISPSWPSSLSMRMVHWAKERQKPIILRGTRFSTRILLFVNP